MSDQRMETFSGESPRECQEKAESWMTEKNRTYDSRGNSPNWRMVTFTVTDVGSQYSNRYHLVALFQTD